MTMQGARTMIFVTKRCNVTAQFPFILLLLMGNFKLIFGRKIQEHSTKFISKGKPMRSLYMIFYRYQVLYIYCSGEILDTNPMQMFMVGRWWKYWTGGKCPDHKICQSSWELFSVFSLDVHKQVEGAVWEVYCTCVLSCLD